jgi:hypothetical protein
LTNNPFSGIIRQLPIAFPKRIDDRTISAKAQRNRTSEGKFAMFLLQYEDYWNPLKPSQEDFKTETLRIQHKFLYSLCSHHRLWAAQTDNPDIASFHKKAAELAQEAMDQYDQILERNYLSTTGA